MNLNKEIQSSKDIISRFDEIICDKASKFSLENVENRFKQYLKIDEFTQAKTDLESQCDKIKDKFKSTLSEIRQVKSDCYKQTYLSMSKAATDTKNEIFDKLGGIPIDRNELQKKLATKADKQSVERLDDVKLNKNDLDELDDIVLMQSKLEIVPICS